MAQINFANYQAQSLAEQQREAEKRRKIEAVKEKQLEASLLKFQGYILNKLYKY